MADNLLSSRDGTIAYLAAQGKTHAEIAEVLGTTSRTIGAIIATERMQFEIKRTQHKLFGQDNKAIANQFKDMIPKALDTMREIIDNPNVKPQLRFSAAQEIFDRSLGKPKQTVELEGSLVKDLYDRLDTLKPQDLGVIDITPVEPEASRPETVDVLPAPPQDVIDAWIAKNL